MCPLLDRGTGEWRVVWGRRITIDPRLHRLRLALPGANLARGSRLLAAINQAAVSGASEGEHPAPPQATVSPGHN